MMMMIRLLLALFAGCALLENGVAFHNFQPVSSVRTLLRVPQKNDGHAVECQNHNSLTGLQSTASSSSSSSSNNNNNHRRNNCQHRDVVIVGSGLAGLSAALYLTQIDPSRHITILDKTPLDEKGTVASFAAAGMLAPNSERLPKGPLLDLCLDSRRLYSEFVDLVETKAQQAGSAGEPYLRQSSSSSDEQSSNTKTNLPPWSVGYVGSGGFLAPAFAGDSVATWAPPDASAIWLDATQARELEPHLHPDVVGGWWFPEDASVDARRLTQSLRAACVAAGVQLLAGEEYEVSSLDLMDGQCQGLWVKQGGGMYISTKTCLIANGAWMRQLLPVPIEPHKGQSLSLRMPPDSPPLLRRVLFAQDSYIVPKANGSIVVGATVEAGSFDPRVTPAGLLHIMSHALELVPALQDLPIEETWVGLRPTTPDKGPILGGTPWNNLFLAGGYWRNGVLLAPKTGYLMAHVMADKVDELSKEDQHLLASFRWDRFTSADEKEKKLLAANARYAASMHPIHRRKSGAGVAASVGTELGSYSTARSAKEERARDRQSLFSTDSTDELDAMFEKAAMMGKSDADAYSGVGGGEATPSKTVAYEGSADAYTVGSSSLEESDEAEATIMEEDDKDLDDVYASIRANKESQHVDVKSDAINGEDKEDRPDPGFRILHVDETTGEETEVPPYTTPGEFLQKQKEAKGKVDEDSQLKINGRNGDDLESIYASIRSNKEKTWGDLLSADDDDADATSDRPDPGFRIYHVDEVTGVEREVPPYTTPGDFLQSLKKQGSDASDSITESPINGAVSVNQAPEAASPAESPSEAYSESTFDGYTVIQQANSRTSRTEELEAMRAARRRNRSEDTDVGAIGVVDFDAED